MNPITSITLFPTRFPMTGRFKFFEGPEGSPTGRASVMVKITAEDGTTGWGESVPIPKWSDESLETAVAALEHHLIPELIGRDAMDLDGIHTVMNRAVAPGFSTGMPITKAGVDIAIHDLIGKSLGRSVPELYGQRTGGPITLSWTLNPRSLDDLDALIEEGWNRGYRHFNVKVAPDPGFDVELSRRVRKAVPEGFLWADANGGYEPETALEAAPRLADAGVDVLEQPLRPNRISGYVALRRQKALPILMDEGVVSPTDLLEFIELGLLDGVAMKASRCGGLRPAWRQMEILRDRGLMILASGLTDPDISLAAALALYGAFGITGPAALNGPQFLTRSVLHSPLRVHNGQLVPPSGPGLGIEVNEEAILRLDGLPPSPPPPES